MQSSFGTLFGVIVGNLERLPFLFGGRSSAAGLSVIAKVFSRHCATRAYAAAEIETVTTGGSIKCHSVTLAGRKMNIARRAPDWRSSWPAAQRHYILAVRRTYARY